MLTGVQQHPDLTRWRPDKNPRKHRVAANARVVLFRSGIFQCAGAVEFEVLRRGLSRCPAVEVSTLRAGLNPKVHSSVPDNWGRSGSKTMFVIWPVPLVKNRIRRG